MNESHSAITVALHLPGLIGTDSRPDMKKIRIIEFFFENSLQWQSEVGEKISTNGYCRLNIYVHIHIPASEFYMPTFRNTLFHLHRQVGVSTCL